MKPPLIELSYIITANDALNLILHKPFIFFCIAYIAIEFLAVFTRI